MTDRELRARVERVRQVVADAAAKSGRDPRSVTIIAVSKTVGRESIDEAYGMGLRHFGENRALDARSKFAEPMPGDAVLHLIGRLQTNKAAVAARHFDVIESVDRLSLVDELERQGAKLGRVIPVLLEVNVSGEEQKGGCAVTAVRDLVAQIEARPHLGLRGLMTMAPLIEDAEATRPVFRQLRELRGALCAESPGRDLRVLSMGMTNDYPIAIEEGATHIRVGRAIFGP